MEDIFYNLFGDNTASPQQNKQLPITLIPWPTQDIVSCDMETVSAVVDIYWSCIAYRYVPDKMGNVRGVFMLKTGRPLVAEVV